MNLVFHMLSILFSTGGNCQELLDWYVDYESSMKWCENADDKVKKRAPPGENIMLVEIQHSDIEVERYFMKI